MNPSLDDGNPPRPFRHLRMAEHRTPDRIYESGPRSFGVGSKIGYHHHQLGRSAFRLDARESPKIWQAPACKKLAFRLPRGLLRLRVFRQKNPATLLAGPASRLLRDVNPQNKEAAIAASKSVILLLRKCASRASTIRRARRPRLCPMRSPAYARAVDIPTIRHRSAYAASGTRPQC
jgi:hypothetical protein